MKRWRHRRFWERVQAGKRARLPRDLDPTRTTVTVDNPFRHHVRIETIWVSAWDS